MQQFQFARGPLHKLIPIKRGQVRIELEVVHAQKRIVDPINEIRFG